MTNTTLRCGPRATPAKSAMKMLSCTLVAMAAVAATAYIGEVIDDFHRMFAVTSATSVVSLEPVWKDLPVGYVTVICRDYVHSGELGKQIIGRIAIGYFMKSAGIPVLTSTVPVSGD